MTTTEKTLREVQKQAKDLRFRFPGKEIVIVFDRGMPRIAVKG